MENPLSKMSEFMSFQAQNMSDLPRQEKLGLRNQIILAYAGAGASTKQLQSLFSLSERQIERVIEEANNEALTWFRDLPKKIRIAAFKVNTNEVFLEIMRMKSIRAKATDPELVFNMTKEIALMQMKYDKMLSEGPTLEKIKDQGYILEELISQLSEKGQDEIQGTEPSIGTQ